MRVLLLLLTACITSLGCQSTPASIADRVNLDGSRHHLVLLEGEGLRTGTTAGASFDEELSRIRLEPSENGSYWTSEWVELPAFHEMLLSWNVDVEAGCGVCIEVRVESEETRSPWLYVGDWGVLPSDLQRTTEFDGGRIDIDYFRSDRTYDRAQARVRAFHVDGSTGECALHRIALSATSPVTLRPSVPRAEAWPKRLPVPFRSQRTERPEIAGRICSPTSVSMVLEYRGVDERTGRVAERIYDTRHDIYGNWTRAVQGAWTFGVPGFLMRIDDWRVVQQFIEDGQPLIISFSAREGQLTGAPYSSTGGHLIVLCGFDENGDIEVNDPAVSDPNAGRLVYKRSELEEVWMKRGGTTYVLLDPTREMR